ncbi:MAG TPA: DUF4124 domain-containing protein [Burkholderiales bacterium]|jgi:hypothetical protein
MRIVLLVSMLCISFAASAQVYRWVDEKGRVTYSNEAPPPGVKAITLDIDAQPGPPSADTIECYTALCQGERMEQRIARREALDAQASAGRVALSPPPVRGLEFRKYISIRPGMTEGELLGIAGEPDLRSRDRSLRTYTYMPTPADPFTTTILLVRGRVHEIERERKF